MKSGAMMSVISLRELVTNMVGMTPSVVPLFGSTAVSGTGSTGQVVGFSQLTLCCRCWDFVLDAGIGPVTCGGRLGVVAGVAGGTPCAMATAAAKQSDVAATRLSAARMKHLGLCFTNVGPRVCLFEAIGTLSAALGRGLRGRGVPRQLIRSKEAGMASDDDAGWAIISALGVGPHAHAGPCPRRRLQP